MGNVTEKDIEARMKPVLEELSKYFKPRVRMVRKAEPPKSEKGKKAPPKPSREQLDYLRSIWVKPDLSVTARGKAHGFSANKSTRLKKKLIEDGLVCEFSVDLGRDFGGHVKLLKLTNLGLKAIGKVPPKPLEGIAERQGHGHRWWSDKIFSDYKARGYRAIREYSLNGKAADIGVITEKEKVAIECEISPKNITANFRKNMEAGFDRSIIACKNKAVLKQAEIGLSAFVAERPEYQNKFRLVLLNEFPFIKKLRKEIRGEEVHDDRHD